VYPEPNLRECKLGFRARHISTTARFIAANPGWLEATESAPYAEAKERLCTLPGVGEKVADCVLLFGAGRMEAFPVDVWILKVMARRYGLEGWKPAQVAQFGRTHFGPLAGAGPANTFSRTSAVTHAGKFRLISQLANRCRVNSVRLSTRRVVAFHYPFRISMKNPLMLFQRFLAFSIISIGLTPAHAQRMELTEKNVTPVVVESAAISTEVTGRIAVTTFDLVFRNPNGRILEGNFVFPLLDGQSVVRFALDINGSLREAMPVEKVQGRVVFEQIERRRVDPGLLEQNRGQQLSRTRFFPFQPTALDAS